MSRPFTSGVQSIGASTWASVLSVNIQRWFPLGLTGLILQSKELSRVFSSTTVWKHQFFGSQSSLWSSSHICICFRHGPHKLFLKFKKSTFRQISFHCTSQILHFYKQKFCGNSATSLWLPFFQKHLFTSSHVLVILIFQTFPLLLCFMMTWDQWSLMWLLQKDYDSLNPQMTVSIYF